MNTEQLREKIAFLKYLDGDKCIEGDVKDFVWKAIPKQMKQEYLDFADQILATCKDTGMAFVVEDAELPKFSSHTCGAMGTTDHSDGGICLDCIREEVVIDMLKADYRQTKEIEVI